MRGLTTVVWIVAVIIGVAPGVSDGAPIGNGSFLYHDGSQNLTWFYDVPNTGPMTWAGAKAWAEGLTTSGHDQWRLPRVENSDESEMKSLFFGELGGNSDASPLAAPFNEIMIGRYWTGAEVVDHPGIFYAFDLDWGFSWVLDGTTKKEYTLAVAEGDFAQAPIPGAAVLMGSELAGLAIFSRRLRRKG
jgi:hypothetical protein